MLWKSLAALMVAAGFASAQTPAPQFEVASIRPAGSIVAQAASGQFHVGMKIDAARVDIGSMSLLDLIRAAYRVQPYQVAGPDWMKTERFDILAKMPEGASKDQVPEMLQALLAERFKLTIHRDNKEQPVYVLMVAKGGPKLKESPAEADPAPAAEGDDKSAIIGTGQGNISVAREGRGAVVRGGPMGTTRVSMGPNGVMHLEADKMTMPGFVEMLSRFVDRPVVDMTELKGTYQIGIDVTMDDLRNVARAAGMTMPLGRAGAEPGRTPTDEASEPPGTSIYATVQQLGLKLEARKSPVEMIVVDHIEKTPTDN